MIGISSILDTFKDTLNPKLWDGDRLLPDFEKTILDKVNQWSEIHQLEVLAVLFYGGNAGYQYSDSSDADVSVYVKYPDEFDYEELAESLYDQGFDFEGIETHLFLKPPSEKEHVEANENVYSVLTHKWVQAPLRYDIDPLIEFAPAIDKGNDLKEQMEIIYNSAIKDMDELAKIGVESLPKESLVKLGALIGIISKLRKNRDLEHKQLREKAIRGERITFYDRATQNEIAWKLISETPMRKNLDQIKRKYF